MTTLPRYPVYVPSKGRHATPHTIRFLLDDGVPFRVVVEQEEAEAYADLVGEPNLLILPESGQGLIYARNWIKDHSVSEGHARHWQIDDNIRKLEQVYHARRIRCPAGIALAAAEDFTDRYTNVALTGLEYHMFSSTTLPGGSLGRRAQPFYKNCRVYSITLVNNAIPHRWRLVYNDDTDLCLQVLADGWCTLLIAAYLAEKLRTMTVRGGNTDDLYRPVDGRLKMSRTLERVWPGVVTTRRRFGRPQHKVNWSKFTTPLIPNPDPPPPRDLTVELNGLDQVRSPRLRKALGG